MFSAQTREGMQKQNKWDCNIFHIYLFSTFIQIASTNAYQLEWPSAFFTEACFFFSPKDSIASLNIKTVTTVLCVPFISPLLFSNFLQAHLTSKFQNLYSFTETFLWLVSKFHQPKPGDSYAEKLGPLGGDEKVHQPPCLWCGTTWRHDLHTGSQSFPRRIKLQ